jgi:endogenous inhibitor of DNA gyrase (YacG/DUF329 family)
MLRPDMLRWVPSSEDPATVHPATRPIRREAPLANEKHSPRAAASESSGHASVTYCNYDGDISTMSSNGVLTSAMTSDVHITSNTEVETKTSWWHQQPLPPHPCPPLSPFLLFLTLWVRPSPLDQHPRERVWCARANIRVFWETCWLEAVGAHILEKPWCSNPDCGSNNLGGWAIGEYMVYIRTDSAAWDAWLASWGRGHAFVPRTDPGSYATAA